MTPSEEKILLEQFAAEHAKRTRHISAADEQQAALNLMQNLSRFEWYRNQCTPAARMAHERELLDRMAAYWKNRQSDRN